MWSLKPQTTLEELGKTYSYAKCAHFVWLSGKGLGAVQSPQLAHALGAWYQMKESVLDVAGALRL